MKTQKSVFQTIAASLLAAIFICGFSQSADAAAASTGTRVHGHAKLPGFSRLLSYDEMMRLSSHKRTAYISGLRLMMRELERAQPQSTASASDQISRSQIAELLSLFDGAQAFAASVSGLPVVENSKVTCGAGSTYHAVKAIVSVPGAPPDTDTQHYFCATQAARITAACPSGTYPVNQDHSTGAYFCATIASYNHLSDIPRSRARALVAPSYLPGSVNFSDSKYPTQASVRSQIQHAGAAKSAEAVLPTAAAATAAAKPTAAQVATDRLKASKARSGDALAFKGPPGAVPPVPATGGSRPGRLSGNAETAPAPSSAANGPAVAPDVKPVVAAAVPDVPAAPAAATDAKPKPTEIVVSPVSKPGDAKPDSKPDAKPDATAADSKDLKACAPDAETPKTCNAGEVEKARQKYASDPDKDCIYAGGISGYQDGAKRAYHCQAPTQFCFGSTNCKNDAGDAMTADYKCDSGKVLCNPLLFGIQADGKSPFCIVKGAHATASCDEAAGDDAVSPLDQKHAGLREAWNDFADHLFTMCHTNQTAAAVHCAECDIISKRLFALNVAARDVKNCGAAMKYEEANCTDDGVCAVRPGHGDPDGSKKAPIRSSPPAAPAPATGIGAKKISSSPSSSPSGESVWENREPASEEKK